MAVSEPEREMRPFAGSIVNCLKSGYLREGAPIFWRPRSFWIAWNLEKTAFKRTEVSRREFMEKIELEKIEFDYPAARRRITKRGHVGVVGSGDLEVLLEPS